MTAAAAAAAVAAAAAAAAGRRRRQWRRRPCSTHHEITMSTVLATATHKVPANARGEAHRERSRSCGPLPASTAHTR